MRYLITGAKGQLGKEFVSFFDDKGLEYIAFGRDKLDVTDLCQVEEAISFYKPHVIINCSAYNYVDMAEKEFFKAFWVNGVGVYNLLMSARKHGIFFVHYSTDYVFDGEKGTLYTEEDETNPINKYGLSKLFGEKIIFENGKEYLKNILIFRVSWVYGFGKQNFIKKFLNWAKEKDTLEISFDEVSVPTWTKVIVDVTKKATDVGIFGLFNLVNSSFCSRYEWAKTLAEILGMRKKIIPVPSSKFKLFAKRPKFSAMSNRKIEKELDISIPHWKDSLTEFLKTWRKDV